MARPSASQVISGPIVDTPPAIGYRARKPITLVPSDWNGGEDTETTKIQLDVIHNNVRQLKKRLDEKGEQNTHDDENYPR